MECYQAEVGSVQSRVCKIRSRKKTMYGKLDISPWLFVMPDVETLKNLIERNFSHQMNIILTLELLREAQEKLTKK